jgi:hypothetical protein
MIRKLLILTIIFGAAVAGFGAGFLHAQNSSSQESHAAPSPAAKFLKTDVPAYHAGPPKGPLPDTLDPAQFLDAQTRNIYTLAAKVKPVLYQEPCYCGCDKEVGHKSLLDCFTDLHGAHCMLCKKEAAFTYSESQQGKTAEQIRKEIIDGKWKDVDLSKYDSPVLPTNSLSAYSGRREEHPPAARSNSSPPLQLFPRTFHNVASRESASIMALRSD